MCRGSGAGKNVFLAQGNAEGGLSAAADWNAKSRAGGRLSIGGATALHMQAGASLSKAEG